MTEQQTKDWAEAFSDRARAYTKHGVGKSYEENMVAEFRCWLRFQMAKLREDLDRQRREILR